MVRFALTVGTGFVGRSVVGRLRHGRDDRVALGHADDLATVFSCTAMNRLRHALGGCTSRTR